MKENLNKDESTIGAIIRPTTSSIIHTTIRKVTAKILIDFPPAAYKNPTESVYTIMNSLIMKYNEQLGGFVISYENLVKLDDSGYIFEDSPYVHFFVQADWTIWSAPNGSKLIGKVVGQSNNHIGLLVLDIFNVKIPYTNMPNEIFEWDGQNDLIQNTATGSMRNSNQAVRINSNRRITRSATAVLSNQILARTRVTQPEGYTKNIEKNTTLICMNCEVKLKDRLFALDCGHGMQVWVKHGENWAVKVILRKKSDVDYLKEAIKVKLSPSLDNVPISRIILKRHGEETELRPGLTIDKNFTTTTDTPIQVLVKESENGKINEILKTLKNQSENLENMVKNRNENLEKMSKELDERETKTISIVTVRSAISIAQELIDKLSLNVKVEPNEFSPRIFSGLIYKTLLVDDKKLSEKNSPFMLNLETSSGKFLKGKSDLYVLWDSSDSLRTFNDFSSRYNSSIDNKIKLEKKFNNINDEGDSPFNFTSEYAEDYYNLFSSHGDENHHNGEYMSMFN
ncbi:8486_t:CDS:10 [Entrophospora sp. SA101]|nr:8486_t:CDS:10 [Entrophospora sp. SA101]